MAYWQAHKSFVIVNELILNFLKFQPRTASLLAAFPVILVGLNFAGVFVVGANRDFYHR